MACMHSQATNDDYLLVTKCEPLGPSEKFEGTWFFGFETSLFRRGKQASAGVPEKFADITPDDYQLIAPTSISSAVLDRDPSRICAIHVVFVGRPSLLRVKPEPVTVVVDKMLAMRAVPFSPSAPAMK